MLQTRLTVFSNSARDQMSCKSDQSKRWACCQADKGPLDIRAKQRKPPTPGEAVRPTTARRGFEAPSLKDQVENDIYSPSSSTSTIITTPKTIITTLLRVRDRYHITIRLHNALQEYHPGRLLFLLPGLQCDGLLR